MRDLLTILAALVIAALTAALALPPLINWGPHRNVIEEALSRAAGMEVATDGAIEIRLLPSPRLKIERVRFGSDAADAPSLNAAFLRAEIVLTPLLSGEVRFRDARIGRAELRLPVVDKGDWRIPRSVTSDVMLRRRWVVEDLAISQFLVTTSDPTTGRTDQTYAENVAIQAQSLAGPWRVEGTSQGTPFQVSTGELGADNAMTVKLAAGGGGQPRIEVDGQVQLKPGVGETLVPDFAGTGKLSLGGPAPAGPTPRAPAPVRVNATANLKAAGRSIALDGVTLEAGDGASNLRLTGTGQLRLDSPRLALKLEGRRFDLDAFRAASAKSGAAPVLPPGLSAATLPTDLALKLDSLGLAGEEWTGFEARGSVARGRIALEQFTIAAPGPTQVTANGEFGFGFAQGGSGRVVLASRSGERFAATLTRLGWGDMANGLLDSRTFDLVADLIVAEPLISLRNLRVAFGDTTLTGALRYTAPDGAARGRVDAQLAVQGLDLAQLPPTDRLFATAKGLDYGLILDMRNVGYGGGRGAGRIAARIASDGPSLRVDRLEIADLAGANGSVSGRIEPDGTGRIEGRMTARRAAPLLDLAGPAWIGGLSGLIPASLRERDLDLSITAERAAAPDGSGPGLRTLLKGRLAGGPFEAETVAAGGELKRLQATLSTDHLRGWASGPDSPALARPARVTITGAPLAPGRFGISLDGDLGGVQIRTTRPLAFAVGGAVVMDGGATINADDIAPLAMLLGETRLAAVPASAKLAVTLGHADERMQIGVTGQIADTGITADLTGRTGADLAGSVRLGRLSLPWLSSAFALAVPPGTPAGSLWPSVRFGPAPTGRYQAQVAVKADSLDLGNGLTGKDAAFDLATSADGVTIRKLGFALADGRVEGEASLSRQGGLASLTGSGTVRDLSLPALAGGAAFGGKIMADLKFGAAGESVAGLVSNLGGAGTLTLSDIGIAKADPDAVSRTIPRALKSDDALAAAKLRGLVSDELDAAPLALGTMSASATLISGALRVAPLRGDTPSATWAGSLSLDLRNLTLDVRGTLQAKTKPPIWSGDPPYVLLGWQGPVSRPARTLDVGPLVNGLASVVLMRELDRIDTFEADQNERQRRTSRREMDRLRRAAEEAARVAAAKASEEKPAPAPPALAPVNTPALPPPPLPPVEPPKVEPPVAEPTAPSDAPAPASAD